MTSRVEPHQLDFGALAAEREVTKGLREYFVESESYQRLLRGDKRIALGNRGAGKSAIFKMIAAQRRQEGHIVVELAPEDYSYELLRETLHAEEAGSWAKQGAYAAAWKYIMYVLAMKKVCEAGRAKGGSVKRIHKYIRDNHDNVDNNPVDTLVSYLKRLEGVKLGQYEATPLLSGRALSIRM